jgi:hypothetical protein
MEIVVGVLAAVALAIAVASILTAPRTHRPLDELSGFKA